MNNKFLFLIFTAITLSCSSGNMRNCRSTIKNNAGHLYSLETMCNYEAKTIQKLDSGNELLVITYKDNSKVFVSNEIEYCPPFSLLFLTEKETGLFTFNEQLVLNGTSDDLTSWRIEKREGFILGYYDVPIEAESLYRELMLSLRSK